MVSGGTGRLSPENVQFCCVAILIEQFQFEMLRISNHTACRFAEKARFFRSLWAGRRCAAASRFTFFKGETLYCYGLRCALGNSPENTSEKAEKIQASGMVAYHVRRFSLGRGLLPGCDHLTLSRPPLSGRFNGAGDRSPDVTVRVLRFHGGPACFNGAGDRSPDVTLLSMPTRFSATSFNGAGDRSPDVTCAALRQAQGEEMLQWGRGSLPGCDCRGRSWARRRACFNGAGDRSPDVTGRQRVPLAAVYASMGPGIAPWM